MPERAFRSLRRAPTLLGAILLLGLGPMACGPTSSRPDGVPRAPVAYQSVPTARASTSLVLRLRERRLDLMKADGSVESFPIAVGRVGLETPTGRFHVEEMSEHPDFQKVDPNDPSRVLERVPPGPANPLGERWIGFAHGEGWSVGIHGTPHPELLGRAVSAGCIRMRNADVIRIYDQVELGTSVVVYP